MCVLSIHNIHNQEAIKRRFRKAEIKFKGETGFSFHFPSPSQASQQAAAATFSLRTIFKGNLRGCERKFIFFKSLDSARLES